MVHGESRRFATRALGLRGGAADSPVDEEGFPGDGHGLGHANGRLKGASTPSRGQRPRGRRDCRVRPEGASQPGRENGGNPGRRPEPYQPGATPQGRDVSEAKG